MMISNYIYLFPTPVNRLLESSTSDWKYIKTSIGVPS